MNTESPAAIAVPQRRDAAFWPKTRWLYFWLALLGLSLFVVLLTGLPNFTDNEWRISAYVQDAIHNGHWFVQTDTIGDVASKPPVLTWLVSLPVLLTGQITRFALYWPSAAATVLVAMVLLRAGTKAFDLRAGYFAAFTYLISYASLNQMEMPRYDGLLTLPVTLGAMAAFRAWQTGKGWTAFWIISALGTLVKGPLALLLAGSGLLAVFFSTGENKRLRGSHWAGILCFLAITGGWFALAYLQMGDPLINKMIRRELVGHAVVGSSRGRDFLDFFTPAWDFFRSYFPWSIFALVGIWRVWKQPAANTEERNLERFLVAWIVAGLILFTLSSHQRGRLILPLIPAAALLAGREMSRWTQALEPIRLFRYTAVTSALFLAVIGMYSHVWSKRSQNVQQTLAAKEIVDQLRSRSPGEFPFTYVDNFHPLQIWANTRRTMVPVDEALKLLRDETPAFVVVTKSSFPLGDLESRVYEVYRWPAKGNPTVRILSNHPRLEWTENAALWLDGMHVELSQTRLEDADENDLRLLDEEAGGKVTVVNRTSIPRDVLLRLDRPGPHDVLRREHLTPDVPMVFSWTSN